MSRESLNNERIRNELKEWVYRPIDAGDLGGCIKSDDSVNHPDHYTQNGYECIDIMLATQGIDAVKSFCICNAFKYIYRHRNKNHIEDIKKAIWYLNKFVELEESNNEE